MRDTYSSSQGAIMTRRTPRYLASGLVAALAIACSSGDAPPAAGLGKERVSTYSMAESRGHFPRSVP